MTNDLNFTVKRALDAFSETGYRLVYTNCKGGIHVFAARLYRMPYFICPMKVSGRNMISTPLSTALILHKCLLKFTCSLIQLWFVLRLFLLSIAK